MKTFFIEETDTFAGEANYSYCKRYLVKANTKRGAMRKIWNGWRIDYDGEIARFNSESGLTCFFVQCVDKEEAKKIANAFSGIMEL